MKNVDGYGVIIMRLFVHTVHTKSKRKIILMQYKIDIPIFSINNKSSFSPGSIPGQFMWDLWWTKWHWERFFPEYFGFSLSISFHRCSITWKNEKKLSSSSQCCTISLKAAVRP
jgi:hypothetical protein